MTKTRRPAAILVTTRLRAGIQSTVQKKLDDTRNATIGKIG